MSRPALLLLVTALVGLTAWACWALLFLWRFEGGSELTGHGWTAMGLGAAVSALIAGGLMWLAFYSSRRGWDDLDREP